MYVGVPVPGHAEGGGAGRGEGGLSSSSCQGRILTKTIEQVRLVDIHKRYCTGKVMLLVCEKS